MSIADIQREKFKEHIVRDSQICGGEPVFKGTRVTLRTVLASLAWRRCGWGCADRFPQSETRRYPSGDRIRGGVGGRGPPGAGRSRRPMKLKLDENLPLQIASSLQILGHDIHTTGEEGLSGCNDSDLWTAAQREGRTLDHAGPRLFRCATLCSGQSPRDRPDPAGLAQSE